MKRILGIFWVGMGVWLAGAPVFAATYEIDRGHSSVGFRIRHLVAKTKGTFDSFSGTIDYDEKAPEKSSVSVSIEATSINTAVPKRDDHLRSADFFDVKEFPVISFTGKKVTDVKPASFKVHGELTMHGVTKSVILDVEVGGVMKGGKGESIAGFSATTKVNRKDFGLSWNRAMEVGGFMVGDEVEIYLEVEAKSKPATPAK